MFLNSPKSHIMLALDTPNRKESFDVLDKTYDLIDAVKFNYPLILREGLAIITDIKEKYEVKVVADFKIADVPVTNNRIVKLVKEAGVDAVMVHGFIGSDALLEIMDIANEEMGVIIVTELTHPGGLEFTRLHSKDFAGLCNFVDAYGIQAPGTRPEQIKKLREIIGPEKIIVSCGIGSQGGDFHDAIEAGADFAIIGRSIYNADNPRSVILNYMENMVRND